MVLILKGVWNKLRFTSVRAGTGNQEEGRVYTTVLWQINLWLLYLSEMACTLTTYPSYYVSIQITRKLLTCHAENQIMRAWAHANFGLREGIITDRRKYHNFACFLLNLLCILSLGNLYARLTNIRICCVMSFKGKSSTLKILLSFSFPMWCKEKLFLCINF